MMPVEREYPSEWQCAAILADGGVVDLRPVRGDDSERIEAFHGQLSDESRYLRFFSTMRKLLPALLTRFTHVDYESRMVLLAEAVGRVVGMASYDRASGTDAANVAFAVADAYQGRGLGTLLLEHLAAIARQNGIHRFTAETLPHNRRMIRVFLDAGFGVERARQPGVVQVSFPIDTSRRLERAIERREHRAEARSVARLLAPESIAAVGESGGVCDRIVDNLRTGGFAGRVHRGTSGTSEHADLVFVASDIADLDQVVERCGEDGAHGLVLLDPGNGGSARRTEITKLARHHGMRVVGPGSIGMLNLDPKIRMNATLTPVAAQPGRIGLLSSTGASGIVALGRLREAGLGLSSFVSVGEKADVSSNDLLQYWEDDPATDVVLLCLESFGNPRKFVRIARRVSARKPIVALMPGVAGAGGEGRDEENLVDALFQQTGVIRVDTMEALVDTAVLLRSQPRPRGRRVGIVGTSGGATRQAADSCAARALEPETPSPSNLGAGRTLRDFRDGIEREFRDGGVDSVIAVCSPPLAAKGAEAVRAISSAAFVSSAKPVVACLLNEEGTRAAVHSIDAGRTLPVFFSVETAVESLARVTTYAEWRRRPIGLVPVLAGVDRERASQLVGAALDAEAEGEWLDEERAAPLLACYGVESSAESRSNDRMIEAAVSVSHDASFGPVLAFGPHPRDSHQACRLLPLTDLDARELVRATPVFGRLANRPAEMRAIERLLLRVARLAEEHTEVLAIDVDPVLIGGEAAVAGGARIRLTHHPVPPDGVVRRLGQQSQ